MAKQPVDRKKLRKAISGNRDGDISSEVEDVIAREIEAAGGESQPIDRDALAVEAINAGDLRKAQDLILTRRDRQPNGVFEEEGEISFLPAEQEEAPSQRGAGIKQDLTADAMLADLFRSFQENRSGRAASNAFTKSGQFAGERLTPTEMRRQSSKDLLEKIRSRSAVEGQDLANKKAARDLIRNPLVPEEEGLATLKGIISDLTAEIAVVTDPQALKELKVQLVQAQRNLAISRLAIQQRLPLTRQGILQATKLFNIKQHSERGVLGSVSDFGGRVADEFILDPLESVGDSVMEFFDSKLKK